MNDKNRSKPSSLILFLAIVAGITLFLSACDISGDSKTGEESGVQLALDETYDRVDAGARMVLSHNPEDNSFNGYVENTTEDTLRRVRVEVHLSTGVALGPTTPVDLAPGERKDIKLFAKNYEFDSWTVHPEVEESGSE